MYDIPLRLLTVSGCSALSKVCVNHQLASLDNLHDVDELLKGHNGSRDPSDNPGHVAINLIRSG